MDYLEEPGLDFWKEKFLLGFSNVFFLPSRFHPGLRDIFFLPLLSGILLILLTYMNKRTTLT